MKLWISKNSEVPVHDQLTAQITLGIASKDLVPGERLPSTRELARRFRIHQNTVSTAYRKLTEQGLVTLRKGSGVYVANSAGPDTRPNAEEPGSRGWQLRGFRFDAQAHGDTSLCRCSVGQTSCLPEPA